MYVCVNQSDAGRRRREDGGVVSCNKVTTVAGDQRFHVDSACVLSGLQFNQTSANLDV